MSSNITILNPSHFSDPEVVAMLLAFYSRSTKPIQERLNELIENGKEHEQSIKESLKKYYLGYGHKSIADCGNAVVFLEGISILAAKAFEASNLFNGQETSSRYIDFSSAEVVDPLSNVLSGDILQSWISFYHSIQEPIKEFLRKENQRKENQNEEIYENAIKAKAFDITRSLLPCGIKTQMGLSMTFSSLNEHLLYLINHPLDEVKNIAAKTFEGLEKQFSSSFKPFSPLSSLYVQNVAEKQFNLVYTPPYARELTIKDSIDKGVFDKEYAIFKNRPKNVPLPSFLSSYGTMTIEFSLDYGSWRDLQRHRNTLSNRCSSVSFLSSFSREYFSFLPHDLGNKIIDFVIDQYEKLFLLGKDLNSQEKINVLQYYYPLGNLVNCELIVTLPQLFYILELRSSKSVHFTLRNLIHSIWDKIKVKYGIIENYIDEEKSEFFFARGKQTIMQKGW